MYELLLAAHGDARRGDAPEPAGPGATTGYFLSRRVLTTPP
jgi:hypothetical protein